MKRLGKVLILLGLSLVFVEIGWSLFRGLVIEPAGNPIQTWFLDLPLWLRRWIFYFPDNLLHVNQASLFWLGIGLLIADKTKKRNLTKV